MNEAPREHAGLGPGSVVSERYRIVKLLAEGGMGSVYEAEHVHMRKRLALKVLHAALSSQAEVVARFEREAIAAAKIDHPNVVAATDFGRLEDGSFFLVLELVDGRALRDELSASGAIEGVRALRIAREIAIGLGAAHAKGIVHRDLKPENIMLVARADGREMVKVLDFGIAKLDAAHVGPDSGVQPLTRIGTVFGTPEYMAPEQAMGHPADARSDLYALGLILYEMLVGQPPVSGTALTVLRERVLAPPPALPTTRVDARIQPLLDKLCAHEPGDRFASATEVVSAVDALLAAPEPRAPEPQASLPTRVEGMIRKVAPTIDEAARETKEQLVGHALPALTRSAREAWPWLKHQSAEVARQTKQAMALPAVRALAIAAGLIIVGLTIAVVLLAR